MTATKDKLKIISISRNKAIHLVSACGLVPPGKDAEKWANGILNQKLDVIGHATEEDRKELVERIDDDSEAGSLLEDVLTAYANDGKVLVEDAAPVKPETNGEAPKKKPKKDKKPTPLAEKEDKPKAEEKPAASKSGKPPKKPKKDTKPTAKTEGGTDKAKVGVTATIIECLKSASKKEPASRESILDTLKKKFPQKPEGSLKNTLNSAIYTLNRDGVVSINKDDEGNLWGK